MPTLTTRQAATLAAAVAVAWLVLWPRRRRHQSEPLQRTASWGRPLDTVREESELRRECDEEDSAPTTPVVRAPKATLVRADTVLSSAISRARNLLKPGTLTPDKEQKIRDGYFFSG